MQVPDKVMAAREFTGENTMSRLNYSSDLFQGVRARASTAYNEMHLDSIHVQE